MQAIIDFIVAHQVAFVAFAIAIIDFAIAVSPKLESNSIIHVILSLLKPKSGA